MGKVGKVREKEPQRAVAPGLALKKEEKHTYDPIVPVFKYSSKPTGTKEPTWSTWDPDTQSRTWTSGTGDDKQDHQPHVVWDSWAAAAVPETKESLVTLPGGKKVDSRIYHNFKKDSELMAPEKEYQTEFERNNADLLVTNFSGPVLTQIGDESYVLNRKEDNRIKLLTRDGNGIYADGIERGQVKKRYYDEFQTRARERDQEMVIATTLLQEWEGLSEIQKQERRKKALRNRGKVLQTLDVELEEAVPDIYKIDNDKLWKRIRDWKQQTGSIVSSRAATSQARSSTQSQTPPVVKTPQPPSSRGFRPSHPNNAEDDLFLPLEDEEVVQASSRSGTPQRPLPHRQQVRGDRPYQYLPRGPRHQGRERALHSHERSPAHHRFSIGDSSRNHQSRRHRGRGSKVPNYVRSGTSRSTTTETESTFIFESWPELVPLDDTTNVVDLEDYIDPQVQFDELTALCKTKGRLVVISLVKEVEFSGAAIIDRIFGGAIQAIQFFPLERQALIAFLSPLDAKAFLDHVEACKQQGPHEYRRLQLHASYYRDEASAVLEAQKGVFSSFIAEDASRAIQVDKIHKLMKRDDLLAAFKHRFEDKHIVRVRLVVPKKKYEREDVLSNSAVLEFESIKEAIEAKDKFNDGQVVGFDHCTAEFLSDPVGRAPTRMNFCGCQTCKPENFASVISSINPTMGAPSDYSSNPLAFGDSEKAETLGSTILQQTKRIRLEALQGTDFDYEEELQHPSEFGKRTNRMTKTKGVDQSEWDRHLGG